MGLRTSGEAVAIESERFNSNLIYGSFDWIKGTLRLIGDSEYRYPASRHERGPFPWGTAIFQRESSFSFIVSSVHSDAIAMAMIHLNRSFYFLLCHHHSSAIPLPWRTFRTS